MNEHLWQQQSMRGGGGSKVEGRLAVTHQSYESLFTTDGSSFPWVFVTPLHFIRTCFLCYGEVGLLKAKNASFWIAGSGFCSGTLTEPEAFSTRAFSDVWLVFLLVAGEGGKGVPGIIWGRGGRGPVIPNACYLTQHTDLLLTRTGLYLQHQCHHMTTVHDRALLAKRRLNTVHNHATALDRQMDLAQA